MQSSRPASVVSFSASPSCCRHISSSIWPTKQDIKPLINTSEGDCPVGDLELHLQSAEALRTTNGHEDFPAVSAARVLILDLVSKALSFAGIDPKATRGQSISVTICAASSSELSSYGVEGDSAMTLSDYTAEVLGFSGPTSFMNGRTDPASALRQGISTLYSDGCHFAVVGAIASSCRRIEPFSEVSVESGSPKILGADVTSLVNAIFLVLRKPEAAEKMQKEESVIRSLVMGRVQSDRSGESQCIESQVQLLRRALHCAGVDGSQINSVEVRGLTSQQMDTLREAALHTVFGSNSSEGSVFFDAENSEKPRSECEGLEMYYGILRTLSWLDSERIPVGDAFTKKSLFAQVFTQHPSGSISSVVLERSHAISQDSASELSIGKKSNPAQEEVDAMIKKYGGPLDHCTPNAAVLLHKLPPSRISVLLTGANGTFGRHVLHHLLLDASVGHVICPIRGNAWKRLVDAYEHSGYKASDLLTAKESGRLVVFRTTDLAADTLGCSSEEYTEIIRLVNTIVHLAWKVDFNSPVSRFESHVKATRNLAELCTRTHEEATYYFLSSFSAYALYADPLIPETPLAPNVGYALEQGYAVSKLIAEHVLFAIHRRDPTAFNLRVVRAGQICGSSATGLWSLDEMVPMMIQAVPKLKAVLLRMPDVQWIPSDICAVSLSELITSTLPDRQHVLHLANPVINRWTEVVESIAKLYDIDKISLLSEKEFIDLLSASKEALPLKRLLPFLHGVTQKGGLPHRYTLLDVSMTLKWSNSLAGCPRIDETFLRRTVDALVGGNHVDRSASLSPVLLFGPWTKQAGIDILPSVSDRVQSAASRVRQDIGVSTESSYVKCQLETLMSQLSAFERLKEKCIVPSAVLGYCLGEYAAAVAAGVLSLETAVEYLIKRSVALNGIDGDMLNVFSDLNVTRRMMYNLASPPDIAIHSGPRHCVLSGSRLQIEAAQKVLTERGIKSRSVNSFGIPFHSSTLDKAISSLSLPNIKAHSGGCTYISGLIGQPISGELLGPTYWLRHMRDRVHFVDAMHYIQTHLAESPLIDMGPGPAITSMVTKYGWASMKPVSLNELLSNVEVFVARPKFAAESSTKASPHSTEDTVKHTHTVSDDTIEQLAVRILASSFGYSAQSDDGILSKSFLELGLQSLDFITFSEQLSHSSGRSIAASLYASESPIYEVLQSLKTPDL